ncbi:hypothetical protein PFAG_02241 [Plasmodium falciparum Santa Lucia]|nr:hypothetical protein PFAG_02241 [Plasmodium falciparum Santa Lucia]
MKLHFLKILLLFFLLLNILVTSYQKHNKNKLYIRSHTSSTTSRLLSECDIQSSIYDKDADMKSVKENFDRQTSQRFEEYQERMKEKRQKRKEQCEKDIRRIILKDKMDKSLAEKVEKCCLRCGCSLGGVAASVGIFGALGTYGWKVGATATAMELATKEGIDAGVKAVIKAIQGEAAFGELKSVPWTNFINGSNYNRVDGLFDAFMAFVKSKGETCVSPSETLNRSCSGILTNKTYWLGRAAEAGKNAATSTTKSVEEAEIAAANAKSTYLYSAIGYSVLTILIIVLVMLIIYLILRYRRKKKMKKKDQYTKLLNQ